MRRGSPRRSNACRCSSSPRCCCTWWPVFRMPRSPRCSRSARGRCECGSAAGGRRSVWPTAPGRTTMHPDTLRLAAYLDGALDPQSQADLRAHVLTCATCAARLERLRSDARHITATLSSGGATPDVRAAVRARLRRPAPGAWLARGAALAGALAALLLFAVLIASRSGATLGPVPDRLFVTDRRGGEVVVLNASDGARLASFPAGGSPTNIVYDAWRDQLYVMIDQS